MAETVTEYVLRGLKEIGVDVVGVAGDYAFPVNDAIVERPAINWIGCCNELNAAYIEVVTDTYEAPPLYKKLHENIKCFYNVQ
jgi:TPP-dependent 2-oxoacid decarboxylase